MSENILKRRGAGSERPVEPSAEIDIQRVLAEIQAIRAVEPKVESAHSILPFELQTLLTSVVGLAPTSLGAHQRVTIIDRRISNPLSTGIPKLDNLNKRFGAAKIKILFLGDGEEGDALIIQFRSPLNVEAVAKIYEEQLSGNVQPRFLYFEPNHLVGDGNHIERIENADGSLHYVFNIGSGDCPAGCIEHVFYRFNLYPGAQGFKIEKLPESSGKK